MQPRKELTNQELSVKVEALIASFDHDTNEINGEGYAKLTDQINKIKELSNQKPFDQLALSIALAEYETTLQLSKKPADKLPVENVEDDETEIDPKIYAYLENEESELARDAKEVETFSLLSLVSATDRYLQLPSLAPKITKVRDLLLDTQAILDRHLKALYEKATAEAKLQATHLEQHLERARKHLGLIQKAEENIADSKGPQTKFGYFNTPEIPEDKPVFCTLDEANKKLEDYFKREQAINKSFNVSCANETRYKGLPVHISKISDQANVRFTASTFKNDKQELNRYAMISYYKPEMEVFTAQVYLQNLPAKIKRISTGFLFMSTSIPSEELMIQVHDIVENVRFANIYNPPATMNFTMNPTLRDLAEGIDLYCKLKGYNDYKIFNVAISTSPDQVKLLKTTMGEKFDEMNKTRLAIVETQEPRKLAV